MKILILLSIALQFYGQTTVAAPNLDEMKGHPYFELALESVLSKKSQLPLPTMEWITLSDEERSEVANLLVKLEVRQAKFDRQIELVTAVVQRPQILNLNNRPDFKTDLKRIHKDLRSAQRQASLDDQTPEFVEHSSFFGNFRMPELDSNGSPKVATAQDYLNSVAQVLGSVVGALELDRRGAKPLTEVDRGQLSALAIRLLSEVYSVAILATDTSELAGQAAVDYSSLMLGSGGIGILGGYFSAPTSAVALAAAVVAGGLFFKNLWVRDSFEGGKPLAVSPWARNRALKKGFKNLMGHFWLILGNEIVSYLTANGAYSAYNALVDGENAEMLRPSRIPDRYQDRLPALMDFLMSVSPSSFEGDRSACETILEGIRPPVGVLD